MSQEEYLRILQKLNKPIFKAKIYDQDVEDQQYKPSKESYIKDLQILINIALDMNEFDWFMKLTGQYNLMIGATI